MSIFAPLADMLGMQRIKAELEDRSLYYLDLIGYAEIEQKIGEVRGRGEQVLASIKEKLAMRLDEEHYHYTIDSRIKQIYSIYNKMYGQNKTFDEIYDLFAVRIIVDEVSDCYNVLGIIHDMFSPFRAGLRTISPPQAQHVPVSAHVVLGREAIPFEVQIRTGNAPRRRVRHRGALEVQGRHHRRGFDRQQARMGAFAHRRPERAHRQRGLHAGAESQSLCRPGARVHAHGRRNQSAGRVPTRSTLHTASTPPSATR